MQSITRQPKILIKVPRSRVPENTALSFGGGTVAASIEPLFSSIKPIAVLGMGEPAEWHILTAAAPAAEVNSWDLCHAVLQSGLGVAGAAQPEFAEPDLQQRWMCGTDSEHAFALAATCDQAAGADPKLPAGQGLYWFRDDGHSQLEAAHGAGRGDGQVRIAHLDTGYYPEHITLPQYLRRDLQRNFVDRDFPNDATDRTSGSFTNLGHGTGTLSILAGNTFEGMPLGGAPFVDVIPVRVADSVMLFWNSAIARGLDYVHQLAGDPSTCAQVITMSMGGLASRAWADAVNALYDLGIFVVTAAGNNIRSLPTHHIVYPARFNRVIAACGVMANGVPYTDLPNGTMSGNYGPASKMNTAIAGYTPNTPWARIGCSQIVDYDGRGTSAATPQVAAAAALWIQKYKAQWDAYSQPWMRVEAVRAALYSHAIADDRLGRGMVRALDALGKTPLTEAQLQDAKQPVDGASFLFLRALTGLGAAEPDAAQQMLELEALQLSQQSQELEQLVPDPDVDSSKVDPAVRRRVFEALIEAPGASQALKEKLGKQYVTAPHPQVKVGAALGPVEAKRLRLAMDPSIGMPATRRLRVFAYDPLMATKLQTLGINETTLEIRWEKNLQPGPCGEYIEVVDFDPSSDCCYAPADLNHPAPLSHAGFAPSESNPRFHQQMAYAVSMKTIEFFERALGRVALWSPRSVKAGDKTEHHFVRRLRIYPHAIREANSFYSPDKKALLLGYFQASEANPGENLPGGMVFCCLSHDIVAHETTHALLDGLHRRFREATNPDVLAFHEAFADIVALFQHFSVPEALQEQIARTQGDLGKQNMLAQLAWQFGQAIGKFGALRNAIGSEDADGIWHAAKPNPLDYRNATEPHDRGSILVAAIFDAFLAIYRHRSEDLIRLATGGTGVLPEGDIPHDLVLRLSAEASKAASHVLTMCIRALDYCPPVDITYGEYFRALITGDRDMVPDDKLGYRVAFIDAFRRRGIYPRFVRNLSVESLCWESPEVDCNLEPIVRQMSLSWDLHANRESAYWTSVNNAEKFHNLVRDSGDITDEAAETLGFFRKEDTPLKVAGVAGKLSSFEVHSVRPVRRSGPDGHQSLDLLVEITQTWTPQGQTGYVGLKYRGGCTLLIDLETFKIRYCIRKRVGHPERIAAQQAFQLEMAGASPRGNYFTSAAAAREPFALMHRGI